MKMKVVDTLERDGAAEAALSFRFRDVGWSERLNRDTAANYNRRIAEHFRQIVWSNLCNRSGSGGGSLHICRLYLGTAYRSKERLQLFPGKFSVVFRRPTVFFRGEKIAISICSANRRVCCDDARHVRRLDFGWDLFTAIEIGVYVFRCLIWQCGLLLVASVCVGFLE